MPRYALLVLPSANRVYASASVELTRAELSVFGYSGTIETFGGVPYVTFSAPSLSPAFADLSTLYAAFEIDPPGLLRPLSLPPRAWFDDDLLTIQKYAGKTNEQFTKLLLNVTALSSAFEFGSRLRVLDPLCGRGTTLNQALMYGWDACGLDIDGKDFDAYRSFLESWLRRKRLKHKTSVAPIRREKKVLGRRMEVDLAPTAEAYKKGDRLELTVVNADTVRAGSFFKPRSFHLVVGDLPYGVRHGSRAPSASQSASLSRQPLELLRAALPGWVSLLRPGGALGLSWNTYGGKRTEVANLLAEAGLTVCDVGADGAFEHRVDQSITRDLIVGRSDPAA